MASPCVFGAVRTTPFRLTDRSLEWRSNASFGHTARRAGPRPNRASSKNLSGYDGRLLERDGPTSCVTNDYRTKGVERKHVTRPSTARRRRNRGPAEVGWIATSMLLIAAGRTRAGKGWKAGHPAEHPRPRPISSPSLTRSRRATPGRSSRWRWRPRRAPRPLRPNASPSLCIHAPLGRLPAGEDPAHFHGGLDRRPPLKPRSERDMGGRLAAHRAPTRRPRRSEPAAISHRTSSGGTWHGYRLRGV